MSGVKNCVQSYMARTVVVYCMCMCHQIDHSLVKYKIICLHYDILQIQYHECIIDEIHDKNLMTLLKSYKTTYSS